MLKRKSADEKSPAQNLLKRPESETETGGPVLSAAGEAAWLSLFESRPERDDWTLVEEHILDKSRREEHSERRWKYFGK